MSLFVATAASLGVYVLSSFHITGDLVAFPIAALLILGSGLHYVGKPTVRSSWLVAAGSGIGIVYSLSALFTDGFAPHRPILIALYGALALQATGRARRGDSGAGSRSWSVRNPSSGIIRLVVIYTGFNALLRLVGTTGLFVLPGMAWEFQTWSAYPAVPMWLSSLCYFLCIGVASFLAGRGVWLASIAATVLLGSAFIDGLLLLVSGAGVVPQFIACVVFGTAFALTFPMLEDEQRQRSVSAVRSPEVAT